MPSVLQEDPADDAVRARPSARTRPRSARPGSAARRPARDRRGRPPSSSTSARPDGGRVPDAADQLEVAEDEAVRRHAQLAARAGDPERDDAPALARQPRRQLDGRHRARRLDDEVELALVSGRPARDVDRLGRAERAAPARARPRGSRRRRSRPARTAARGRSSAPRACRRRRPRSSPPAAAARAQQPLEHDRRRARSGRPRRAGRSPAARWTTRRGATTSSP